MTGPSPSAGSPLADPMVRRRRRYHPHLPGFVYALTTLFLAVGAINSQNNLLFWAFGLGVAGMLVSGVISGAALMGIQIERLPIDAVNAGSDLSVRYRVRNVNRLFPAFALTISEMPNKRDRAGDWRTLFSPPVAFIAHVGPRQTVEAAARSTTLRRGCSRLDTVMVWTTFPFGLARKSVTFSQPRRVIVRPAPVPVQASLFRPSNESGTLSPRTARRSHAPGEFFALREHQPGDSPRSIAWRASARTGALMTRQFASSRTARLWIALELADDAPRGEAALSLAAGAIEGARRRAVPVGLLVRAIGLRTPAREGRGHADALLDSLAELDPTAPTGVAPRAQEFDRAAGDTLLIISARDDSAFTPGAGLIVLHAGMPEAAGAAT